MLIPRKYDRGIEDALRQEEEYWRGEIDDANDALNDSDDDDEMDLALDWYWSSGNWEEEPSLSRDEILREYQKVREAYLEEISV